MKRVLLSSDLRKAYPGELVWRSSHTQLDGTSPSAQNSSRILVFLGLLQTS